jgi:hypothetical protein
MKQKWFTTLGFCLLVAITAQSQVLFNDMPLQQALNQAKKTDKIVMIVMESDNCKQCNEMTTQSFTSPVLARAVNSNCIALKIKQDSKEFAMIDSAYSTYKSIAVLFLDPDGILLQRYTASSSSYIPYLDQLNKALIKKEHPDTEYKELVQAYNDGKRDFDLLYKLVGKKTEMALEHDQLLEEMVGLAPGDSATSLTFIQFLAEQGPTYDSKVYMYMHKDNRNFNDAWYLMSQQRRVAANNRMIGKSKNKAIRDKNRAFAERVATMAAGTFSERTAARKAHDRHIIDYLRGVKDTTNFLQYSVRYYDQHLMTIGLDSVRNVDSVRRNEMMQNRPNFQVPPNAVRVETELVAYVGGTGPSPNSVFIPIASGYSNELNSGAWTIYTFTHDPVYTAKALVWAKRATEYFENPGVMDTYARLLYRSGNKQEAIKWEEKVVQYCKTYKMPLGEFEEIANKMKAGKDPIDNY